MKAGDLVTISEKHRSLASPDPGKPSPVGLIIEHYPAAGHLDASVDVLWAGNAGISFAFPDWLEVINCK